MADRMKFLIAEKMKEIMKKKPLDKVRVSEICREAEIDRSTFYYHFKDKYALVAWIFYHSAFETNVISVKEAAESLQGMKNEITFYRRAYDDNSQNALWTYMLEYFVREYSRIAEINLGTDRLSTQLAFSIRLYCYGAVCMSKEWILSDHVTPAETAIRMMFESMPQSLKEIYFRNGQPE